MAVSNPPLWAQAIKARREALGRSKGDKVTQEEISARTGDAVSQRTVSHLEKGTIDIKTLAYGRVVALAKALDWTLPELQQATGLDMAIPQDQETEPEEPQTLEMPDGLREAVEIYGDQFPDLKDPKWQAYLSRFRWRSGQPTDPLRWLDTYRDLVRNGIVPEGN